MLFLMNVKKHMINKFKKIVIKIGSSSIVNEQTKKIKIDWLNSICKDIASMHPIKKLLLCVQEQLPLVQN